MYVCINMIIASRSTYQKYVAKLKEKKEKKSTAPS